MESWRVRTPSWADRKVGESMSHGIRKALRMRGLVGSWILPTPKRWRESMAAVPSSHVRLLDVVLVLSLIPSARVSGALGRTLRRAGVETRLNAFSCLIGLAQQGARANAGTCHASCFGMCFRDEATEWKSRCGTRRAKSRRGSSLTLGPNSRADVFAKWRAGGFGGHRGRTEKLAKQ